MNYHEFLNYIENNFLEQFVLYEIRQLEAEGPVSDEEKEELKDSYCIEIHQVIKNNGIKLDGLVIRKKDENISPNIYLNSYFDDYKLGKPITCIMEELTKQYFLLKSERTIQIDNLFDYNTVKKNIIIRLVNYEKNREILQKCPYKRFLDLAITYRYMAERDENGLASSLISYDEFSNWNIDEEELYQVALFNTMREFPWHMESLAKVILKCLKRTLPVDAHGELEGEFKLLEEAACGANMYVLSNNSDLNGASCMLYDSVIRNFAKVQDSNIIILPSSVHEVILVPEQEDTDIHLLQDLVINANQSAVGLIDLLSDSVYYYDLGKDEFKIYG